jgi:hypothetical protein
MSLHKNGLDAPGVPAFVLVGQQRYQIQWGPLVEYLLSARNVTLQQILEAQRNSEPRFFALAFELLSAMLAHSYKSGEQPKAAELASRLAKDQFKDIWQALFDCMK